MLQNNCSCKGCNRENYFGHRFKCLHCSNYEICEDCFERRIETLGHPMDHPMQLIVGHGTAVPLLYGKAVQRLHVPNGYSCPYCNNIGLTAKSLMEHIIKWHRHSDILVVCPLCAGLPGTELVSITNLSHHLLLNHVEHVNQVDPHLPQLIQKLERRVHHKKLYVSGTIPTVSCYLSATANRSLNHQGRELLYHLSQLQQRQPELNIFNRNQSNDLVEIVHEDAHMLSELQNISSMATLNMLTQSHSKMECQEHLDAKKFLLPQLIAIEEDKNETELKINTTEQKINERQQHAVFAEHLLISMLCEDELRMPRISQGSHFQDGARNERKLVNLSKQKNNECKAPHVLRVISLPWLQIWKKAQLGAIEIDGYKNNYDVD